MVNKIILYIIFSIVVFFAVFILFSIGNSDKDIYEILYDALLGFGTVIIGATVMVSFPVLLGRLLVFYTKYFNNLTETKLQPFINEIKNFCLKHNIEYKDKLKIENFPNFFKELSIMNCSNNKDNNYLYVMKGEVGNFVYYLFDYYYYIKRNKGSSDYQKAVCIITKTNINFPSFKLRDEDSFIDGFGKLFGNQDINFSNDKVFSEKFVLQGTSEKDIRMFFNNSKIRKVFVDNHIPGYQYETYNDSFAISYSGFVHQPCDLYIRHYGITRLEDRLKILNKALEYIKNLEKAMSL